MGCASNHAEYTACGAGDHAWHWACEGSRPERLMHLLHQLDGWLNPRTVGHHGMTVAYERPFARGAYATRSLWGMAGIIEAVATRRGCAVVDVTPTELKKFATGSGKADKSAMIAAARRLGYEGDNEHEADAWCLLQYIKHHGTEE